MPLIVGMIGAAGLEGASVFCVFGALQILTGLIYGLPMPMQPLKVMAVLVISQKLPAEVLLGGGFAIGAIMLVLSAVGGLGLLSRWIPRCVVRGIQFGLGLKLATLALSDYVPAGGASGYLLAGTGTLVMLALWGNRRIPPGLLVIAIGVVYALVAGPVIGGLPDGIGITLPSFRTPAWSDVVTGFFVLALPQLPLSVSNSLIATEQTIRDLFPERTVGIERIGLTYAVVNLVAPLFGGIPVCHGCGGLAGHYTFGARTGGSVVIYGSFFVAVGVLLGAPLEQLLAVFPLPILGVVLLFEALTLLRLLRDQSGSARDLTIALLVGVVALTVPQGFLVALVLGTIVYYGFSGFGVDHSVV